MVFNLTGGGFGTFGPVSLPGLCQRWYILQRKLLGSNCQAWSSVSQWSSWEWAWWNSFYQWRNEKLNASLLLNPKLGRRMPNSSNHGRPQAFWKGYSAHALSPWGALGGLQAGRGWPECICADTWRDMPLRRAHRLPSSILKAFFGGWKRGLSLAWLIFPAFLLQKNMSGLFKELLIPLPIPLSDDVSMRLWGSRTWPSTCLSQWASQLWLEMAMCVSCIGMMNCSHRNWLLQESA